MTWQYLPSELPAPELFTSPFAVLIIVAVLRTIVSFIPSSLT